MITKATQYMSVTLLATLIGGCASTDAARTSNDKRVEASTTPHEIDGLISEVDTEMEASRELKYAYGSDKPQQIPHEVNKEVEKWLRYFTEQDRERFQRFLNRGAYYKDQIEAKLVELNVPKEIYYLAMIESGFSVHASSHASAVGVWQFIKPTGERYGLIVNELVDERRDPVRSTVAAASYLRDLYTVFQSWFLAMAAYNAGESRILNAIMRQTNRNFWELARNGALPNETMNYVPKFIAASIIGHHPEKFGFTVSNDTVQPKFVTLTAPSRVYLSDIASALDIPVSVLKEFNPNIRTDITPDHRPTYELWVPEEFSGKVKDQADKLASLKRAPKNYALASRGPYRTHRVKRGETLAGIAMIYDTNVTALRKLNGLRSASVTNGTLLKVRSNSVKLASASNDDADSRPSYHVVRRGETLAAIAKRYDVSVSFVKERNDLRNNKVVPGKRLMLTAEEAVPKTAPVAARTYRVRRGDNLNTIARRFGVNVGALKTWNNLSRNHVYIGEILKLSSKG